MNIFLYFVFLLLLTSCVTSKITVPASDLEAGLPPDHQFSLVSNENNSSNDLFFQSLDLNDEIFELIGIALKKNPGWMARLARIELARAKVGYFIDESKAQFNTSVEWAPGKENTRDSKFQTQHTPEWRSRANFGWEFDLWGKWTAHKKEAQQFIDAEIYTQEGAQLILIYEIAQLWYQYAYLEEDLSLIKNQIQNHQEFHILHLHNYHAGLDSNQSLITMENEIKTLVIDYNQKKRELEICKIQLSSLMGDPLDFNASNTVLFSQEPIPLPPARLPSHALKNRPDILEAQARFIGQSQLAKASMLNLYPSINLNLTGLAMTSDLSKPFEQWKVSGGPILDIPIWSPQRKTQLSVDQKKLKVMELVWKETILNAIQDIEASLITHQSFLEDFKVSQSVEGESLKLLNLITYKYEAGLLSKIDLLKKMNIAEQAKRKANAAQLKCFFSFFNLSKSLGINWKK